VNWTEMLMKVAIFYEDENWAVRKALTKRSEPL